MEDRQLESQVVDLTRLRLVFGLPLACQRSTGEDHSNEAVSGHPKSDDWNNFAPAVGFSWSLPWWGKDKTVLRVGYGWGYQGRFAGGNGVE